MLLPNGLELFPLGQGEAATLYREIFSGRCWMPDPIKIEPRSVIVDVGANIGVATLFFHIEAPGSRIYAFEPAPEPFAMLQRNMSLHGIAGACDQVALSAEVGEALFCYYPRASVMSGLYPQAAEEAALTTAYLRNSGFSPRAAEELVAGMHEGVEIVCRVETISSILARYQIAAVDYLKIDVEKAELDVLDGIAAADWPRIRQIGAEVHDADGRLSKIEAVLAERGFEVLVRQDRLLAGTAIHDVFGWKA